MTVTERLIPARQCTRMPHFLERASSEEEEEDGKKRRGENMRIRLFLDYCMTQ